MWINLKILFKIKNIVSDEDIDNVIDRVGLFLYIDKKVKKYLFGMK